MSSADTWLDTAARIAHHLCETAVVSGNRCTWLGVERQWGDQSDGLLALVPVGPTVYSGTAGIALFLAEAGVATGEERFGQIALDAIRHATSRADEVTPRESWGVYTGRVGIAYAAARVGAVVNSEESIVAAQAILDALAPIDAETMLDVTSGLAGAVPVLLRLATLLEMPALRERARDAGIALLQRAERTEAGWSWPRSKEGVRLRGLTGLSHGAAGYAWALLELHHALGDDELLQGAREAFRYENSWYRTNDDNWPDFRVTPSDDSVTACSIAWCHGAPGIGLVRLRAAAIAPRDWADWIAADVNAAIRSTRRELATLATRDRVDQTPCHGAAGLVEFLSAAAQCSGDAALRADVERFATTMAKRFRHAPHAWPCAIERGPQPSLMTGLAGIGHSYLRLARPDVPSHLLIGPMEASEVPLRAD